MTADGTHTGPRAGETITTTAQLDALPVGSIVRDREGDEARRAPAGHWTYPETADLSSEYVAKHYAPLTVLFRPDAPQPATTDDAVERAARAIADAVARLGVDASPDHDGDPWWQGYRQAQRERIADLAHLAEALRAALAAAGAPVTEVDREVLAEAIWNSHPSPWGWAAERRSVSAVYTYRTTDAVLDFLAARGAAAEPTEVEWGVRGRSGVVRYPDRRAAVAHSTADQSPVQRTVSAWREVEGGEQRG